MFCKTLTFFEKISVTRNQCFPVYCQLQNENVAGKVEREDQCAKTVSQRHYVEGWRLDKLLLFPIQSREGLEEEV